MQDRLKILDCNRKNILGLPDGALKLWLTYYMNEDDDNESWISIPEIEAQTGMGRTSIVKWTAFLRKNKWLIDTGKTAADKLLARGRMPSSNARQVKVFRVDDPTSSKHEPAELSPLYSGTSSFSEPATSSIVEPKVYCSGSGSGCASNLLPSLLPISFHSESIQRGQEEALDEGGKAKPQNPNQKPSVVGTKEEKPKTKKPREFPDGTPWPKNFDNLDNVKRTELILAHTAPPRCNSILDDGSAFCTQPSVGKHQSRYRNGKYGPPSHCCALHMKQAKQLDYQRENRVSDRLAAL
jgi:hypothetical protein